MKQLLRLLPILALAGFTGCSKKSAEPAPHTGDPAIEAQTAPQQLQPQAESMVPSAPAATPATPNPPATAPARPAAQSRSATPVGTLLFVYAERVRARTSAEVIDTNIAGILDLNDQVVLIDNKQIGREQFVQVQVTKSANIASGTLVFVSAKFLSTKQRALTAEEQAPLQFVMVQNIATERVRVYQRCPQGSGCVNKLVFESEMVAGQDDDGTRTNVGYYKIQRWQKFYEDGAKRYPSWYHPNYPPVPGPGSRSAWFSKDVMPGGRGEMRGAFGWYTALVGPNPAGQWTHGTIGWGADKDDFITFRRSFSGWFIGLFTAIRSHGCTRVDNETISYLRHILPKGTTLVKVYAKEALRDAERRLYANQKHKKSWDYILTKTGWGQDMGQGADASQVLASGTPRSEWIDKGTYAIDQYPDLATGNLYDLDENEFSGAFVVDEGTFVNYRHPPSVDRGGFMDQVLPSHLISYDANVHRKAKSSDR